MKTKREAPNELTDAEYIWEQKAKNIARRDAMIIGMDGAGMSLKAIATKLAEFGYAIGLNAIGRVISAERRANDRRRDPRAFRVDGSRVMQKRRTGDAPRRR